MRALIPRSLPLGLITLASLCFAPGLRAQTISGTVVDPQGNPVPFANLNVFGMNGNPDPAVFNDGTDINGIFNTTVNPSGTYRVEFRPPATSATPLLVLQMEDVVVPPTGTNNLGVVTLPAGVIISGRFLSPFGVPLQGINLDVVNIATNENIVLPGDVTNSAGIFSITAPIVPIEVLFDTTSAGTGVAPHKLVLDLNVNTNLGDVQAEVGFAMTAIVRNSGGSPVGNADFDVIDTVTGEERYTPGDNSNGSTGLANFVVAAGLYDVEVCAPLGVLLVPQLLKGIVVNSNTNLGVITLLSGQMISGHLSSSTGQDLASVNIDVFQASTGVELHLCRDNSDGNGDYAIVVPSGIYDMTFSPRYSDQAALGEAGPVSVSGATTVNRQLPFCAYYVNTGTSVPGTGGVTPTLTATGGTPRLGNDDYALAIQGGRGRAWASITISIDPPGGSPPIPFRGTVMTRGSGHGIRARLAGPPGAAGAGGLSIPLPIPNAPQIQGWTIRVRCWIADPAAPGGVSRTRNLQALVCP